MQKITKKNELFTTANLIYILSLISGLFTWWVMEIRNDWINVDSILYLDSAKAILQGDWQKAYQIYNWPFYSTLIAFLAKVTGLQVLDAAKTLNIIFFSITMFSSAKIIEQIKPDKLALLCFALFLLGSQYIAGSALPMLLRDEGFWATLSTSVLFLIRYLRNKKLSDALLWQIFIVMATLFRIEGSAYLLTLPLVTLLYEENKKTAIFDFLKLNTLFLATLICAILTIPFLQISAENIGRLNEINPMTFWNNITGLFTERSKVMANTLGEPLAEFSSITLAFSLILITLAKELMVVKLPGLFTIWAYLQGDRTSTRTLLPRDIKLVLIGVLITATLTSLASTFRVFVLSARYVVPFGIFILIIASIMLSNMLKKFRYFSGMRRTILIIIIASLVGHLTKNIWPKPLNYNYQKLATDYIIQNGINMADVAIFTREASFYGQKDVEEVYLLCENIQDSIGNWGCLKKQIESTPPATQYILIPITAHKKGESAFKFLTGSLTNYVIVQEFNNPRKDKKLVLLKKI